MRSCKEEEMSGEAKFIPRERNAGHPGNYVFDRNTPPVLEVEPGESFTAETEDTYNGILRQDPGRLQPRDMKPYCDRTPVWYNPVCGPVYVRGVEPGDNGDVCGDDCHHTRRSSFHRPARLGGVR